MLSKTFTLLLYLNNPKNYFDGRMPIYMRFTIDRQRIEIATKRDCEPDKWNASSGRKVGQKEDVRALNAFLDSLQTKVYEAQRNLVDAGKPVTANSIYTLTVPGMQWFLLGGD